VALPAPITHHHDPLLGVTCGESRRAVMLTMVPAVE
jgi:hypothetical protein